MKRFKIMLSLFTVLIIAVSSFNGAAAQEPKYLIKRITEDGKGRFGIIYDVINVDGKYYVADEANDRIDVFDKNWVYLDYFGVYGTGNGQLSGPWSLYSNGTHIFVVERLNNRISIFDSRGNFVRHFGEAGSAWYQLSYPFGITMDSNLIYVTDVGNGKVVMYNATTLQPVRYYSRSYITTPYGIDIDNGILYLCDATAGNVVMVDAANGNFLGNFVNYPDNNQGAILGGIHSKFINNHLVVIDTQYHRINIYDRYGKLVDHVEAQLDTPVDFALVGNQMSVVHNAEVKVVRAVANPTNVQVYPGDQGVTITWNIDQLEGVTAVDHYNIFRYNGTGSSILIGQSTTTVFSDVTTSVGQQYTYSVQAVSAIATSDYVGSSLITIEGSSQNKEQTTPNAVSTVTVNGSSTGGSFLSNLPVDILPVVFTLVMIPIIFRRKIKNQ